MGANTSHIATQSHTPRATLFAPQGHHYHELNISRSQKAYPSPPSLLSTPTIVQPCMAVKITDRRVMTFHSKACWSGYLESSKALSNLVVVYFTNKWYEPCRYMEPIFTEFAADYTDVEFVKIDVDELHDLSRYYGIQENPTFVLIKRGKVVDKVVGASEAELKWKIEKHS